MDVIVSKEVYEFGDFLLDAERRLLRRNDETVNLHPKAFDLLLVLVRNRDRVLSKNELLNLVWENQFVEENNLAVQISTLRKIFGERKDEHRFILTVPAKGYRFIAEVREESAEKKDSFEQANKSFEADNSFSKTFDAKDEAPKNSKKYLFPFALGIFLIIASAAVYWFYAPKSELKQLKLSKLTTNGKVTNAVLTHDGKYAVLAQKESAGESLWLKQLETGTQTRIADPQAVEYVGLSVSPDDKYIYYSVFLDNKSGGWLRRMPLIGGAAQEITGIDSGVSISFAPDGKRFVFTESNSSLKETRLITTQTDGSSAKILLRAAEEKRKLPTFKANPAAWSPDGNEIACAVIDKNADGAKAGIVIVDAENGSERFLLAPRFAWIDNLVWTDAENLAFVASETDEWSSQIWSISKSTGETRKLTNDLNRYFWLSAANKSLLTIQENSKSSLRIADFEESQKEIQTREILNETGIDYVAFGAENSIYYVSQSSGKREIWRVGKDGLNPAQITIDARVSYGFTVSPADGSIFFSSAREGKNSVWTADKNGGNFHRLTDADDIAPQISKDGKRIAFQRGLYDFPTVWNLALNEKAALQLVDKHALKPTISPDGSIVAYYFMDEKGAWSIGLVSTKTGEFLRKLNFPVTVNERRMRWHPSGKFLAQIFNSGETVNLLLMPIDGKEAKVISGFGKDEINSFDWSQDGKQIIFSQSSEMQDAVVLADF